MKPAWRSQRPANDWRGFLANFREVVRLSREEATLLAAETGLSRYDALMDRYEPGVRAADIDRIFADVIQWLPDLISRVTGTFDSIRDRLPFGDDQAETDEVKSESGIAVDREEKSSNS